MSTHVLETNGARVSISPARARFLAGLGHRATRRELGHRAPALRPLAAFEDDFAALVAAEAGSSWIAPLTPFEARVRLLRSITREVVERLGADTALVRALAVWAERPSGLHRWQVQDAWARARGLSREAIEEALEWSDLSLLEELDDWLDALREHDLFLAGAFSADVSGGPVLDRSDPSSGPCRIDPWLTSGVDWPPVLLRLSAALSQTEEGRAHLAVRALAWAIKHHTRGPVRPGDDVMLGFLIHLDHDLARAIDAAAELVEEPLLRGVVLRDLAPWLLGQA